MAQESAVRAMTIAGSFEIDPVLNDDNRGWFKENYQRQKMEVLGLSQDVVPLSLKNKLRLVNIRPRLIAPDWQSILETYLEKES